MTESPRVRLLHLLVGLGTGGAEVLVRESLPHLIREGFAVSVWSLKGEGTLGEEMRRAGAEVRSMGGVGGGLVGLPIRLVRELRRHRFDVIHSHLFWANLAARVAGRSAGAPVIVNSHHGTDGWSGPFRRSLDRGSAGLADAILVCSESVHRHAVERIGLPEGRVVTVQNGIEAARFDDPRRRDATRRSLGLGPDAVVIGSVGRLDEPVKGFGDLVEAMGEVARRAPRAICLVAGDGPARARLEGEARRRGLAGRMRFLGERREIPDFLAALDLYVQPSRQEGFGLAILEAMAASKAVVATTAGGIPEVVESGQTGDLVPPGDPRSLAAAVIRLLEEPARRLAYGQAGRERAASRFPLDRMVRGWTDCYRRLLAGREAPRRAA